MKRQLLDKEDAAKLLLISIVLLAVLVGIDAALKGLDPAEVNESLRPAVVYVKVFFGSGVIVFCVGLARNVTGYLVNYFKTDLKEAYNPNKFYATMTYYLGFVTNILALIPPPYNTIAVAIVVVLDYARSTVKLLI